MGFNFGDLLTVAEGAIERDRFHTDADLKIRGELLVADKNAYITRKNKKYDSELKSYEEEQTKVNEIKSLNASMPSDGSGNAEDYAIKYNMILYPKFLSMDGTLQRRFINATKKLVQGKDGTGTLGYDSTSEKTKEYLEGEINNLSNITSKIYADKLVQAKGNSFLINKIVGGEEKPLVINDDEINKAVADQMKALNITKDIEKVSAEEMGIGKKLEASGSVVTGRIDTSLISNYEAFSKAVKAQKNSDEVRKFDKDQAAAFLFTSNTMGADTENFFELTYDDKAISKILPSGAEALETYASVQNNILQAITTDYAGIETKWTIGDIPHLISRTRLNDDTKTYYYQRASVLADGKIIEENTFQVDWQEGFPKFIDMWHQFMKDEVDILSVIPMSVLDLNNTITYKDSNDETQTLQLKDSTDLERVKYLYKVYLLQKGYADTDKKKTSQQKINAVQSALHNAKSEITANGMGIEFPDSGLSAQARQFIADNFERIKKLEVTQSKKLEEQKTKLEKDVTVTLRPVLETKKDGTSVMSIPANNADGSIQVPLIKENRNWFLTNPNKEIRDFYKKWEKKQNIYEDIKKEFIPG